MTVVSLKVDQIIVDHDIQMRESMSTDTVKEYAENCEDLPPIEVFDIDGKNYVADGFHRLLAHKMAQRLRISAIVFKGTKRDAILHACRANAKHGLKRTNEDKRRSVNTLLMDEVWSKWSDRKIATEAGVSNRFVSSMRNQLCTVHSSISENPEKTEEKRIGVDGKLRPSTTPKKPNPSPAKEPEVNVEPKKEVSEEPKMGDTWQENLSRVNSYRHKVNELVKMLKEVPDAPGFEELSKYRKQILNHATNAKEAIVGCIPHSVCPYCLDVDPEICTACKGKGWVNKSIFDNAPEEKRDAVKRLPVGGDN